MTAIARAWKGVDECAHVSVHFTCTTACEPTAGRLACLLLRAPTLTRVRSESPAATALKVRVQRLPCPLTPVALGGRVVAMATRPLSSRWTREAIWPSRLRRSPESTLTSWRTAGLNFSWRGTEKMSRPLPSMTATWKVLPTVWLEVGGTTVKLTGGPPGTVAGAGD